MAKRHSDPRQYFLGSVPTLGDKCIHTSKLPSNREVLFSFVIRKEEEYAKNKTFKSSFKAAMATVQEEILPIYSRARIPTKSERNIAQDIIELQKKLQDLMKIKKEKREMVKSKERIESFKQSLKETMVCWPKDALHKIKNEEDKAFLVSMQTDRIASLAGKDLKTHQAEKKQKKKTYERFKASEEQRSEGTVAVLVGSSDDQSSSADESFDMAKRNHKRLKKTGIYYCNL